MVINQTQSPFGYEFGYKDGFYYSAAVLLSLEMDVQKMLLGVFFIAKIREENDEQQK